jgi:hypothetical protein
MEPNMSDVAEITVDERLPGLGPKASQELMALPANGQVQAIIPRSLEEVYRMAQLVSTAGWAPSSFGNDVNKISLALMAALELGVSPLQGLKGIAIINGRPAIWGDLAVALCQAKGLVANQEVIWTGEFPQDDFTCEYRIWRRGQPNPYVARFSIADAKVAKLWANSSKLPWIQHPKRMLFNRPRAFALRDGFADHLAGMAIAEEAFDLPPPKPMGDAVLLPDGSSAPQKADLGFLDDEIPGVYSHPRPNAL